VGDRLDLSFIGKEYLDEKGMLKINQYQQSEIDEKIFVPGDVNKLGLFTDAIADGRRTALNIHRMLIHKER